MKRTTILFTAIAAIGIAAITYFIFFKEESARAFVTTKQIFVYRMQINGEDFFDAVRDCDFLIFSFQDDGTGGMVINSQSFNGTSSKPLTATKINNTPTSIPPSPSPSAFTVASCVLSKLNIDVFFSRIRAGGFDFTDHASAARFFITLEVDRLYNFQGTVYPEIKIRASLKNNPAIKSKFANPNPCPPCSFTVYTGES
jgi:hypothetical protein